MTVGPQGHTLKAPREAKAQHIDQRPSHPGDQHTFPPCSNLRESQCQINVLNKRVFGQQNENVLLNCTSTCSPFYWKSRLRKASQKSGDGWSAVELTVQDLKKETAECIYAVADGSTFKVDATVIGYVLPSGVDIDIPELLEEGTLYNVTCKVYDVSPIESLAVALLRNGEVVGTETFQDDKREGKVDQLVTYQLTAQRSDNLKDFSCKASLEFLNDTVTSDVVTVRTFSLPSSPALSVKEWIETGNTAELKCVVFATFPVKNVTLEIQFNKQAVNMDIEKMDDGKVTGSATYPVTNAWIGEVEIVCTANVFGFSKSDTTKVNIYDHPKINFLLPEDSVDLNGNVTASCKSANDNPEQYTISITHDGHDRCQDNGTDTVTCEIHVQQRVKETRIECRANVLGNPNINQIESKVLTVYYPPQFEEKLCPNTVTWVENKTTSFPCNVDGNPVPKVECQIPDPITRASSDNYTCQASNRLGTVEKTVTLIVEYQPSSPTVSVIPRAANAAGGSVNFTCESDCLPSCEYTWVIPSNEGVTIHNNVVSIPKATSSHTGTYSCQARNRHGMGKGSTDITVKDNTLCWVIIVVVSLIVLLCIGGLVLYCLYRKGKIGSYRVQDPKSKPSSTNEETIPMNNGV
ncbi:intercellular adhesion molecule 5 [Pelodytes ibericus]